ncbi:hypothetical protein niasHS_010992 [Heterodera schachtii]|uniref:Annexin n=1 Tax=Heterodera schachtii TaxID=97005 RepID=A0ABD2J0S2_HETSC
MYRFFSVAEEAVSSTSSSVSPHSICPLPSAPFFPFPKMLDSLQLNVPVSGTNGNAIYGVGIGILNGQKETDQQQKRSSVFARQKSSSEEADRKKRLTMPLIYRMYESQSDELCGTVRGPDDDAFHPEEASKRLRNALAAGIQSDDKTLIDVLLEHNNFHRQKIATAYENMYGRILADDIEEESGGHFMESILALLQPAHVYSAHTLYFAISGKSFERSAAVEIGLTSTASQLGVIRDTYQNEFRVQLERDLSIKVEGLFGKMLAQLLMRKTDFAEEFDLEEAQKEADILFKEGTVEELGRSMELFNRVFGLRSARQIQAFVDRYDKRVIDAQNEHGNKLASGRRESRTVRNFEWTIRKSVNIHSDIKQAILLYVRISKNMQLYFAEKLHEAVSQTRPDHQTIIRLVVSRSEIDLFDICNEYKRKYGHNLMFDLQNMCSGDFLRLLSRLVNPTDVASGDGPLSA